MTFDLSDFVEPPVRVNMNVNGLGTAQAQYQGTIKWSFENDEGVVHHFLLPESLYVPELTIRFLSPQHWAQQNRKRKAHSDTDADRITMEWDDSVRTVPLNAANVGFMRSAPGYTKASPVITTLNAVLPAETYCFPTHPLIPTDNEQTDGNQPQVTTAVSEGEIENESHYGKQLTKPHMGITQPRMGRQYQSASI
jgi:hypothetical protein